MSFQDEYKIVERITGSGSVNGSGITEPLPVRYELMIQESINSQAPALQQMKGTVWSTDEPFLAARLLNKELTLTLADGRIWDFSFIHRNGQVAKRGASAAASLH